MYILTNFNCSNATPFAHGNPTVSDPGPFTGSNTGGTGSNGSEFTPFADASRTIYATDPYRPEPSELYGNPGAPGPDFGGHVSIDVEIAVVTKYNNIIPSFVQTLFKSYSLLTKL